MRVSISTFKFLLAWISLNTLIILNALTIYAAEDKSIPELDTFSKIPKLVPMTMMKSNLFQFEQK